MAAVRAIIYVGKAKSLRSRLNSYFADVASLHPRTQTMVTTAAKVEWTVIETETETEVEALQLEYSWIKEFDPRLTHTGCTVGGVEGGTINCPCHGSKFSIEDGSVVAPPAPSGLEAKQVTVTGGMITLA